MKRAAFLLLVTLAVPAFQIISNCSQPLESSDLSGTPTPGPGSRVDTIYVVNIDTVIIEHEGRVDTVIVLDTVIQVDTVTLTDTLAVDTVIIVEPGTDSLQMLCDRLSSSQQEIIWLFRNAEGSYHLEFAALAERDNPTHTLTVNIDGQAHEWNLTESLELVLDQDLGSNTTIQITTSKPPSYGHSIDVCLTWTAL